MIDGNRTALIIRGVVFRYRARPLYIFACPVDILFTASRSASRSTSLALTGLQLGQMASLSLHELTTNGFVQHSLRVNASSKNDGAMLGKKANGSVRTTPSDHTPGFSPNSAPVQFLPA